MKIFKALSFVAILSLSGMSLIGSSVGEIVSDMSSVFKKIEMPLEYYDGLRQKLIEWRISQQEEGLKQIFDILESMPDPQAQYDRAIMLQKGEGCVKDEEKAQSILEQLSSNSDHIIAGQAANMLGVMYELGRHGVEQSHEFAIEYYEKAKILGSLIASNNLNNLLKKR